MDIVQDRNRTHLHQLLGVVGDIGHVKSASECLPDIDDKLSKIPASSFADPASRRWPCHTKEAMLISAVYMADAEGEVDEAAMQNLSKFARVWNLEDETKSIFLRIGVRNELRKQAEEAVTYALDEEYDGQQVQRFPVDNGDLTKISTDRFYADRTKYPYAWRVKTAAHLIQAIDHHGVSGVIDEPVREYLEKAAGLALGDRAAMWQELAQRRILSNRDQPGIDKLAEAIETVAEANEEAPYVNVELTKLACQALSQFDSANGYKDHVQLPEEVLFASDTTFTKVAAERQHFMQVESTGQWVDTRQLTQEKVAAIVPELADKEGTDLYTGVAGLPADRAEALIQLL